MGANLSQGLRPGLNYFAAPRLPAAYCLPLTGLLPPAYCRLLNAYCPPPDRIWSRVSPKSRPRRDRMHPGGVVCIHHAEADDPEGEYTPKAYALGQILGN